MSRTQYSRSTFSSTSEPNRRDTILRTTRRNVNQNNSPSVEITTFFSFEEFSGSDTNEFRSLLSRYAESESSSSNSSRNSTASSSFNSSRTTTASSASSSAASSSFHLPPIRNPSIRRHSTNPQIVSRTLGKFMMSIEANNQEIPLPALVFALTAGPLLRRLAHIPEELEQFLAEFSDDNEPSYEELLELDAQNARRGVPESVIKNLPVFRATTSHGQNQCQICQENFTKGATIMKLPCKHFYCVECISKWFERSKNCPICRREICE